MAFEQQCEQLIQEFESFINTKTISTEDFTKEIQIITKALSAEKQYTSSFKDVKVKKAFLQIADMIERSLDAPGSLVFVAMSCDLIRSGEQTIRDLVDYLKETILEEAHQEDDFDEFEDGFDDGDLDDFDHFDAY